jgi:hypothetical protein
MLWPLLKRRRRGSLWAVQALVPGDSLGDLSLVLLCLGARLGVAWGIGARGQRLFKRPLEESWH